LLELRKLTRTPVRIAAVPPEIPKENLQTYDTALTPLRIFRNTELMRMVTKNLRIDNIRKRRVSWGKSSLGTVSFSPYASYE
jgi:hypothetical protein